MKEENVTLKLILCIFFGYLGVHKFYEKKYLLGTIYLFTFGLFSIGWIYDIIILTKSSMNTHKTIKKDSEIEMESYIKISNSKFPKTDDDFRTLKYEYYDVSVKGTEYREFDISKIKLDHMVSFETEPDNQYDENAIKILYDNIFIGYIPKNNLQNMMKRYSNGSTHQVCGFISFVNEKTKEINIGLGFYSN